jgi:hypothetical protein
MSKKVHTISFVFGRILVNTVKSGHPENVILKKLFGGKNKGGE